MQLVFPTLCGTARPVGVPGLGELAARDFHVADAEGNLKLEDRQSGAYSLVVRGWLQATTSPHSDAWFKPFRPDIGVTSDPGRNRPAPRGDGIRTCELVLAV